MRYREASGHSLLYTLLIKILSYHLSTGNEGKYAESQSRQMIWISVWYLGNQRMQLACFTATSTHSVLVLLRQSVKSGDYNVLHR